MIENFEEVKKQLEELAPILNSFKSEAVQLRILEVLFQGQDALNLDNTIADSITSLTQQSSNVSRKGKRATKKSTPNSIESKPVRVRTSGARPGPGAILDRLIKEGFFKTPQTIGTISDYCTKNLAYTYQANELSVALTRAIRSQKLARDLGKDNQYQYYQP